MRCSVEISWRIPLDEKSTANSRTSVGGRWREGRPQSFYMDFRGIFSVSSQNLGQVFSSSLVRRQEASVLVNRWKDANVRKYWAPIPACVRGAGLHILKAVEGVQKTCTAGFGNLIRLMKAAPKKWAEGLQMFLISGLKLIGAFCYRVSEAFQQEIWEELTSNQTGGSKFNRNLNRS